MSSNNNTTTIKTRGRNKIQLDAAAIEGLKLQGKSYGEIAKDFGVSKSKIFTTLRGIEEEPPPAPPARHGQSMGGNQDMEIWRLKRMIHELEQSERKLKFQIEELDDDRKEYKHLYEATKLSLDTFNREKELEIKDLTREFEASRKTGINGLADNPIVMELVRSIGPGIGAMLSKQLAGGPAAAGGPNAELINGITGYMSQCTDADKLQRICALCAVFLTTAEYDGMLQTTLDNINQLEKAKGGSN